MFSQKSLIQTLALGMVFAAAAGGAHPETVRSVAELKPALERALHAIRSEKRAAVIDAHIA